MESHHEVERTYAPGADQEVPDLTRLPGVRAVARPETTELSAVYFDTRDLVLTRAGVSLRRRTGGDDEGWHLKIPSGDGRDELRLALGRSHRTIPISLRRTVLGWTRHAELTQIATIATTRTAYALLDDDDQVLAELADDHVQATPSASAEPTAWREWELELVGGKKTLLKAADKQFGKAGVRRSESARKIVRALGQLAPEPLAIGKPAAGKPAGRVVQHRLAEQVAELVRRDSEIRRSLPSGVHRARVACRRLRSALATFGPLLDPDVTDPLRAELRWLQGSLGDARDAHVVHERLRAQVAGQELVIGPVRRRLDQTYGARARAAREVVIETLSSPRYLALLDALDALAASPPWTEAADKPATKVLPRLVRRDWKRLVHRVEALDGTVDDRAAHDHALHEVRKSAKRLRYAVETVEPIWSDETGPLHAFAKTLTQVLGEHQDTVVSRQDLLSIAAEAANAGESSFTYGRLHGAEERFADDLQARFEREWGEASPKELTAWLR